MRLSCAEEDWEGEFSRSAGSPQILALYQRWISVVPGTFEPSVHSGTSLELSAISGTKERSLVLPYCSFGIPPITVRSVEIVTCEVLGHDWSRPLQTLNEREL